jgi:acyl carrier protein
VTRAGAATPALAARLAGAHAGERATLIAQEVGRQAAQALGWGGDRQVPPTLALRDLGLDSLGALELRNALAAALGRPLPSTLLFDYPTVAAIVGFLEPAPAAGVPVVPVVPVRDTPVPPGTTPPVSPAPGAPGTPGTPGAPGATGTPGAPGAPAAGLGSVLAELATLSEAEALRALTSPDQQGASTASELKRPAN